MKAMLLIVVVLLSLCYGCRSPHERRILWPDSQVYSNRVTEFRFNEKQAYQAVVEELKGKQGIYFHDRPQFIVGNEYSFGDPLKGKRPLTGFYVDGNTGRIVHRKSTRIIRYGAKTFPRKPFKSEEVIRDGESP